MHRDVCIYIYTDNGWCNAHQSVTNDFGGLRLHWWRKQDSFFYLMNILLLGSDYEEHISFIQENKSYCFASMTLHFFLINFLSIFSQPASSFIYILMITHLNHQPRYLLEFQSKIPNYNQPHLLVCPKAFWTHISKTIHDLFVFPLTALK